LFGEKSSCFSFGYPNGILVNVDNNESISKKMDAKFHEFENKVNELWQMDKFPLIIYPAAQLLINSGKNQFHGPAEECEYITDVNSQSPFEKLFGRPSFVHQYEIRCVACTNLWTEKPKVFPGYMSHMDAEGNAVDKSLLTEGTMRDNIPNLFCPKSKDNFDYPPMSNGKFDTLAKGTLFLHPKAQALELTAQRIKTLPVGIQNVNLRCQLNSVFRFMQDLSLMNSFLDLVVRDATLKAGENVPIELVSILGYIVCGRRLYEKSKKNFTKATLRFINIEILSDALQKRADSENFVTNKDLLSNAGNECGPNTLRVMLEFFAFELEKSKSKLVFKKFIEMFKKPSFACFHCETCNHNWHRHFGVEQDSFTIMLSVPESEEIDKLHLDYPQEPDSGNVIHLQDLITHESKSWGQYLENMKCSKKEEKLEAFSCMDMVPPKLKECKVTKSLQYHNLTEYAIFEIEKVVKAPDSVVASETSQKFEATVKKTGVFIPDSVILNYSPDKGKTLFELYNFVSAVAHEGRSHKFGHYVVLKKFNGLYLRISDKDTDILTEEDFHQKLFQNTCLACFRRHRKGESQQSNKDQSEEYFEHKYGEIGKQLLSNLTFSVNEKKRKYREENLSRKSKVTKLTKNGDISLLFAAKPPTDNHLVPTPVSESPLVIDLSTDNVDAPLEKQVDQPAGTDTQEQVASVIDDTNDEDQELFDNDGSSEGSKNSYSSMEELSSNILSFVTHHGIAKYDLSEIRGGELEEFPCVYCSVLTSQKIGMATFICETCGKQGDNNAKCSFDIIEAQYTRTKEFGANSRTTCMGCNQKFEGYNFTSLTCHSQYHSLGMLKFCSLCVSNRKCACPFCTMVVHYPFATACSQLKKETIKKWIKSLKSKSRGNSSKHQFLVNKFVSAKKPNAVVLKILAQVLGHPHEYIAVNNDFLCNTLDLRRMTFRVEWKGKGPGGVVTPFLMNYFINLLQVNRYVYSNHDLIVEYTKTQDPLVILKTCLEHEKNGTFVFVGEQDPEPEDDYCNYRGYAIEKTEGSINVSYYDTKQIDHTFMVDQMISVIDQFDSSKARSLDFDVAKHFSSQETQQYTRTITGVNGGLYMVFYIMNLMGGQLTDVFDDNLNMCRAQFCLGVLTGEPFFC
jgi:hypothetical protein